MTVKPAVDTIIFTIIGKVYGPEDVINNLKDSDLYAEVNLSDIIDSGSYAREAIIYSPTYNNVWGFGKNEIQIVVSD